MAQTETYEGWANRETWAVALHINNEQGWQQSVYDALRQSIATDMIGPGGPTEPKDIQRWWEYRAGQIIQENVEDTLDGLLQSVFDHMSGADPDAYSAVRNDIGSLWRVDWTEIGASFLADLAVTA
jgi:hypothetical protein